jgi:hypothetical protein
MTALRDFALGPLCGGPDQLKSFAVDCADRLALAMTDDTLP